MVLDTEVSRVTDEFRKKCKYNIADHQRMQIYEIFIYSAQNTEYFEYYLQLIWILLFVIK